MKNILVSGVSQGLGWVIAKDLLKNGYQVFGFSRTASIGVEELRFSFPQQFHWSAIDLAETDTLKQKIVGELLPTGTPLHGLVNNAAIAYDDLLSNAKKEELEKLFAINTIAPILISKYVIRNMLLHRTEGSLVHISSISTQSGYKGLSMYAASKGALEAFSKNVAREWGSKGIRSNCVVPGFLETAMSSGLSAGQKEKIIKRSSLKKQIDLESVAATVRFLLADDSKSMTAQNLIVDAGS